MPEEKNARISMCLNSYLENVSDVQNFRDDRMMMDDGGHGRGTFWKLHGQR